MTPDDLKDIPDGALVRLTSEGRLHRNSGPNNGAHCLARLGEVPLVWDSEPSASSILHAATAVEVLPEPVVEPKGIAAVVTDTSGDAWVRRYGQWLALSGPGSACGPFSWSDLVHFFGPLTVEFEGVDS